MTTAELIEHLKSIDPEGNLPVVKYWNWPASLTVTPEDVSVVFLHEDDSSIPSTYFDEPDDDDDKATPVVYID